MPKVLLLGNFQTGKSSFIKSLVTEDLSIEIGDGTRLCTKEITFQIGTMKGTKQKVVFIDTMGLGSNANEDHDRNTIAKLKNDL